MLLVVILDQMVLFNWLDGEGCEMSESTWIERREDVVCYGKGLVDSEWDRIGQQRCQDVVKSIC
ncbi:hypothetical protein [Candidatus Hodgkinia cicadicola]|uniref:hypothetical protein n=1 Tax=Candidatus Hodgkinia cicadicola TaxID=573658 RepID=UPI001788D417